MVRITYLLEQSVVKERNEGKAIRVRSPLECMEEKHLMQKSAEVLSQISSDFTHFCCWITSITLIPMGSIPLQYPYQGGGLSCRIKFLYRRTTKVPCLNWIAVKNFSLAQDFSTGGNMWAIGIPQNSTKYPEVLTHHVLSCQDTLWIRLWFYFVLPFLLRGSSSLEAK